MYRPLTVQRMQMTDRLRRIYSEGSTGAGWWDQKQQQEQDGWALTPVQAVRYLRDQMCRDAGTWEQTPLCVA